MKVLLDENLSQKIVLQLADLFTQIKHARDLYLKEKPDTNIWKAAKEGGFDLLITTDRDFLQIAAQNEPPPKLVRIEQADVKTAQLAAVRRNNALKVRELLNSKQTTLIINAHQMRP
ncbi:MAG TPA: DUF5615 family PIN-like protein [Bryobacteraceae bacterium]|jgi:predicted nuclease of predicted toxin-antitoxin system|nr:DUF5615 family PIN-like protein [Bryobacteraceae bacterium]